MPGRWLRHWRTPAGDCTVLGRTRNRCARHKAVDHGQHAARFLQGRSQQHAVLWQQSSPVPLLASARQLQHTAADNLCCPRAGVNNNAYQISRALYHNSRTGANINDLSHFVKADFMNMPFEDSSFDAVYQIDATCHAPDQVGCYKVRIETCSCDTFHIPAAVQKQEQQYSLLLKQASHVAPAHKQAHWDNHRRSTVLWLWPTLCLPCCAASDTRRRSCAC